MNLKKRGINCNLRYTKIMRNMLHNNFILNLNQTFIPQDDDEFLKNEEASIFDSSLLFEGFCG